MSFSELSTPDESRGWKGLLVHVLDSEVLLDHDLGVELDPLHGYDSSDVRSYLIH